LNNFAACTAWRRLFLVGSALTERFDPVGSDLDFLVEFEPHERRGFDDEHLRFRAALEQLFARPVDLIEARARCETRI
jgi:predicted nucleotidyltransferase